MFRKKKAPAAIGNPTPAAKPSAAAPATAGPDLAAQAKAKAEAEQRNKEAAKRAQAQAEERQREAEMKRKAKEKEEQLAREKAAADAAAREKAAKEAAEAEKKAKMEREAEDARWRAQLASMASSALLTQSLEKELADELSEVRKKLSAGKEAVESLEREILEVEASSVAGREAKAREIGALKEQLASLVEMRSGVADFDLLMGGLVNGAKDAHEELEQQGADALGVAARMERELDAAKQRLRSADEHKVGLEKQLEKAKADAAPQEAQAASELMRLTDAAVAAKCQDSPG